MRISDWSSDVCSSDLVDRVRKQLEQAGKRRQHFGLYLAQRQAPTDDERMQRLHRTEVRGAQQHHPAHPPLAAIVQRKIVALEHVLAADRKSTRLNSSH